MQKIRECTWWAHKKAEAFQAKEAQHHKCNYDKWGRAEALEVGDMVLVCVTAFKGHHKMQDLWENRKYVVEKWPYPKVPVYVVCPRDGKGATRPYIGTICFLLALIYSRLKWTGQQQELGMTHHELQHHLWVMHLLEQSHLGSLPQAQMVAPQKAVQIDLLPSDMALGPLGTNFL